MPGRSTSVPTGGQGRHHVDHVPDQIVVDLLVIDDTDVAAARGQCVLELMDAEARQAFPVLHDELNATGIAQQLGQLLALIVNPLSDLPDVSIDLNVVRSRPFRDPGDLPIQVALLVVRGDTYIRDRLRLRIVNLDHPATGIVLKRAINASLRRPAPRRHLGNTVFKSPLTETYQAIHYEPLHKRVAAFNPL